MIRINQVKARPESIAGNEKEALYEKAAKALKTDRKDLKNLEIVKRSIDARKKPDIWYSYVVDVETDREEAVLKRAQNPQAAKAFKTEYCFPAAGTKSLQQRPVIAGAGPAGLFCGYLLARHGYCPLILERGKDVDSRQADVEEFWRTGMLHPGSNVQFGEGGAGTFSDGKLNTLIKDRDGRGRKALEIFVECGAPKSILYESKPHIGTDILCKVVKNMRLAIEAWGGEVRFEQEITDITVENARIVEVEINGREKLPCTVLVLAIGHSARNTFEMLHKRQIPMEAKAFAVGLRVEHPQKLVNLSQYGMEEPEFLPAAAYKVTARTSEGRGVYSFCMCPGGYVVNASSEPGRLAVNGMSYSDRAGRNANSAVIVSVTPADFDSSHPLAGIAFQRMLEERAYVLGNGKVPVQTYGDFKSKVNNTSAGAGQPAGGWETEPCIKGAYAWADVSRILPESCNRAFVEGMEQFGRKIKDFNMPQTLLSGVESRTSSPVRIHREENGQCGAYAGIYPCGEGAGYAGGITSAAMDGMLTAQKIASEYAPMRETGQKC